MLHAKILHDPEQAAMNVQLIEDLLGCPREHLQEAFVDTSKRKSTFGEATTAAILSPIAEFEEAEAHQFAAHRQLTDAARPN